LFFDQHGNAQTGSLKIDAWTTSADQTVLLKKFEGAGSFSKAAGAAISGTDLNIPGIEVNPKQRYQSVDGFGYTLTGGSAHLINRLAPAQKKQLLQELFGKNAASIGISYLRISIGASDLNESVFSYDDLPTGTQDLELKKFNLSADTVDLIPLLKEIVAIQPKIKILGSPWSPPVWMKSNQSSIGGNLLPQFYQVYAKYFVKYIQTMAANGIKIDAVTIQNEPEHGAIIQVC